MYYNLLEIHLSGFFNLCKYSITFVLLGGIVVLYKERKNNTQCLYDKTIILLLLACTPFVGSNGGIVKYMAWPIIPILWLYSLRWINKVYKCFFVVFCCAMLAYSYNGLRNTSFFDVGLNSANYKFGEGVLEGISTYEEKGTLVGNIERDFIKYKESDYNTLVLRKGFDYLLEYVFLSKNKYLGSRFDFTGFDDDLEYIGWVESEILNSDKTIAVLYMLQNVNEHEAPKGDVELTPMQKMLQSRLNPAVVKDGYVIYTSK